MTGAVGKGQETMQEARLPRRDWILLPAFALLTACGLAAALQWTGEQLFPASDTLAQTCLQRDPRTGVTGIPNKVCWAKLAEGQWVEYRFNSCGYRAGMECGPRQPGTYRIVMTGSSFAMGWGVRRENTFAALLPIELSRETGQRIELYNEGMGQGFVDNISLHFRNVLEAQPDLILWIVTPFDIEHEIAGLAVQTEPGFLGQTRYRIKHAFATEPLPAALSDAVGATHELLGTTGAGVLLDHYLFQSPSEYVKLFLMGGEAQAGPLMANPGPEWQARLRQFNSDAADIEKSAKAAGVPIVAVLVPDYIEVSMIAMDRWPAGYDPYKLDRDLRAIIENHGGSYIDILPDFRGLPDPARYYYPVDGHPNDRGHALIASFLARELIGRAVLEPRAGVQPEIAMQPGR